MQSRAQAPLLLQHLAANVRHLRLHGRHPKSIQVAAQAELVVAKEEEHLDHQQEDPSYVNQQEEKVHMTGIRMSDFVVLMSIFKLSNGLYK